MSTPLSRIRAHLREQGLKPVPPELRDDLQILVSRCEIARRQGANVHLSKWLMILIGLTRDEQMSSELCAAAAREA